MRQARELQRFSGRNMHVMDNAPADNLNYLPRLGINITDRQLDTMYRAAQDAIQPDVTTNAMPTLVQFVQTWMSGFVRIATQPRKIDELVGMSIIGNWFDEQIVQGVLEWTGKPQPYGDLTNVPLASWNANYYARTIVRFEEGFRVGPLEQARSGVMNLNTAAEKRNSAAFNLDVMRNLIGFYGYNSGNNNTYGFLNDPGLPAYVTAANGASTSPLWSTKTYLEIVKDIRQMLAGLRTNSKGVVDPDTMNITIALANAVVDYLGVVPEFGNSVKDWLTKTYPRVRIVSAPELDGANGGANVAYAYADEVPDSGTDDQRTFIQMVQSKFQVVGIAKEAKGYVEDYLNAMAGVMLKRPYAVYRLSGI
jgi:hypothetical protein